MTDWELWACVNQLRKQHGNDALKVAGKRLDAMLRSLSILVVEDEPLVRMATAAMLADLGHRVIEAGTGNEAVAVLEAGRIDVLTTDVGLSGMSGTALAAIVRDRWPDIAIVIASGLAERDNVGLADDQGRIAWLQKPMTSPIWCGFLAISLCAAAGFVC